jgi:hypothetical protein
MDLLADRSYGTARIEIRKYDTDDVAALAHLDPYEIVTGENLLMYGGASCQWETLIGNGTNTGSGNLQYFNATNSWIGVGDSSAAAAATQTDLQAATNRLRKPVSTGPTHTDGVVVGSASCVWVSVFASGDAQFAWNEWGLFNNSTFGSGRMLNRGVISAGTKGATVWTATATLSLA